MLRVTVEHFDTHVALKVEGSLKGSWVDELEHCWLTVIRSVPNKAGTCGAHRRQFCRPGRQRTDWQDGCCWSGVDRLWTDGQGDR